MRHIHAIVLMALCCACSVPLAQRAEYLQAYNQGDLNYAESKLNKTIAHEIPNGNLLRSKDAVWLCLDRATMRFAKGNINEAISDFRLAIDAMDYYSQACTAETMQQIAIQDDLSAYAGEDFEQVLARIYFALALLHEGDTPNAFALLRQAEELQQTKQALYGKVAYTKHYHLVDNAIGKYLFASLLENRGDYSNAKILYEQTGTLVGENLIKGDLERLPRKEENATVLVICHNGRVPQKVSMTAEACVASAIALEMFLSTQNIKPALSSLPGIPVPVLCENWNYMPSITDVTIDGKKKEVRQWYDVATTAEQQLIQQHPVIVARGVARFALRRALVGYAQRQDPTLGALSDIAMLIANASTQADTRSWTTLPSSIDLARYDLKPGEHELKIDIFPNGSPPRTKRSVLNLKANDFCVINIFNISPHVSEVLIPSRFLNQQVQQGEKL